MPAPLPSALHPDDGSVAHSQGAVPPYLLHRPFHLLLPGERTVRRGSRSRKDCFVVGNIDAYGESASDFLIAINVALLGRKFQPVYVFVVRIVLSQKLPITTRSPLTKDLRLRDHFRVMIH